MSKAVDFILSRILQAPHDVSLRRLLADSLQTESTWQSELVACQCELDALLHENPFRRNFGSHKVAEQSLLNHFKSFEHGSIRLLPDLSISLHNGLLEQATTNMGTFVECAEECLSPLFFPFLNRLTLYGGLESLGDFINCHPLSRFEHIWFGEILFDDSRLLQFLESRFLSQLKSLSFQNWGDCTDKSELRGYGGLIAADGAYRLAHTKSLSQIELLNLCLQDIGPDGARHLASSSMLRSLSTLIVDQNDIFDEGIAAFGDFKSLESLCALSVRSNGFSLEGVRKFFRSDSALQLRCIDLSSNPLGSELASVFSADARVGSLKVLVVSNCKLGGIGFRRLLDSVISRQCHTLDVNANSIGSDFFQLCHCNHRLIHLSAARNDIPDTDRLNLPSSCSQTSDPTLISLDLGYNKLGDGFAGLLATSPIFGRLETLRLRGNQIGDSGAEMICHSPHLRNLRWIELDADMLSENTKQLLQRTFANRLLLL